MKRKEHKGKWRSYERREEWEGEKEVRDEEEERSCRKNVRRE